MEGPSVLGAIVSIGRSLITTRRPSPSGTGCASTAGYALVLGEIAARGPDAVEGAWETLEAVVDDLARSDPDMFDRAGALGFWLDLYNAGALALALRTAEVGDPSVLRTPGAFTAPFTTVAGERLSLDAVEHGKIRRFGDPRVHAAMVCGSISCPTLRSTPYSGTDLDAVLDDQLGAFLASGGIVADRGRNVVRLSRVFAWFGGDIVRPARMPTLLPARGAKVLEMLLPHVEADLRKWIVAESPRVEFLSYDWGLRCTVGS